ncbi:RNA polymerase sigma factor [Rhizorhabdus argentea]|uniref:RNA polymerase sigma factor n=1 Tax=Rhizorhabdus argentea TaxID=1387174 RepID=UPI0030EEBCC9
MGSGESNSNCTTLADAAGPVRRWLTAYFRRHIRNHDEVDDLVQDVFTRVVARDSVEPIGHLGGYILRTATSVLADRARRRAVRHADLHVVLDVEQHGDEGIDPERILRGKENLHAATAALLSLPERTRTVFVLRRLEGCSHKEIASQLGISISAVEKHMIRAVHHLSTEMEKRDAS